MTSHNAGLLQPPVHEDDHIDGNQHASITLVEYGDYQCEHCARAHPIIARIRHNMGETLRFVFRNFPLKEMHPNALHAAMATESVAAHHDTPMYWAMHDMIYEHQQDSEAALDDSHLANYAAAVGANAAQVTQDLVDNTFEERVRADFLSGVRSGVNGTPTFYINGVRFDGDWSDEHAFIASLKQAPLDPPHGAPHTISGE